MQQGGDLGFSRATPNSGKPKDTQTSQVQIYPQHNL